MEEQSAFEQVFVSSSELIVKTANALDTIGHLLVRPPSIGLHYF